MAIAMSTESSNLVSSIDQVSSASSGELELSFESSLDQVWQYNTNIFPQPLPTPPSQLPISHMSAHSITDIKTFILWV